MSDVYSIDRQFPAGWNRHRHDRDGQVLAHSHPGGDVPHGYFGHLEDQAKPGVTAELKTDIPPGPWNRFCVDHAIVTRCGGSSCYPASDPDIRVTRSGGGLSFQAAPEAAAAMVRLVLAAWDRFGGCVSLCRVRQAVLFAAAADAATGFEHSHPDADYDMGGTGVLMEHLAFFHGEELAGDDGAEALADLHQARHEETAAVYHPDPVINAEVAADALEGEIENLAAGFPPSRWRCPECGAEHSRGHFGAVGVHRCLACGYSGAGGVMLP